MFIEALGVEKIAAIRQFNHPEIVRVKRENVKQAKITLIK
jgi:hypothetical protein